MLLVMDVGNTNTVLGVYDATRLLAHWRLTTVRDRTVDEYGILARNLLSLAAIEVTAIDSLIIASVVPPLNSVLEAMVTDKIITREQATTANAEPVLTPGPAPASCG